MSNRAMNSKSSDNDKGMQLIFVIFAVFIVLLPEVTLAGSLQKMTTDVSAFVVGDLKKLFVTGGGILGTSAALVKGNLKLAGAVGVVAVILAMFLTWVDAGMQVLPAA